MVLEFFDMVFEFIYSVSYLVRCDCPRYYVVLCIFCLSSLTIIRIAIRLVSMSFITLGVGPTLVCHRFFMAIFYYVMMCIVRF